MSSTSKLHHLKLHQRIALPFTGLFVIAIVATVLASQTLIARALESRLDRQVGEASEVLSLSDFALNRSILERIKQIVNAEIVTYTSSGEIIATTIDGNASLIDGIASVEAAREMAGDGPGFRVEDRLVDGVRYRVAYRPVPGRGDTVIGFAVDMSEIEELTAAISRTIAGIGLVLIACMAVVSHLVARGIASPLARLTAVTDTIAAGNRSEHAPVEGGREVARLGESFNAMLESLRQYEDKLLRSEKLAVTGLLAAQVAHDVRNPLSSMKMQAQLLRASLPSGSSDRETLQSILRDIDRIEGVITGMLELAGHRDLECEDADVNRVVAEVLEEAALQLSHRNIDIVRDFSEDLPRVRLDIDRFKRGLANLVVNARDAMSGGGSLTTRTSRAEGGSRVRIEILDNGTGLDPRVRDRLFHPFVSSKKDGVGLGLVNARSVVEQHGGTLALEPRPEGGGTQATIVLPAIQQVGADG